MWFNLHRKTLVTAYAALVLLVIGATPISAEAKTHQWISSGKGNVNKKYSPNAATTVPLQPVIITGTRIDWGTGFFDDPYFNDSAPPIYASDYGSEQIFLGIVRNRAKSLLMSDVCNNPALSNAAKTTTSGSDMTNRWLTAQETFNYLQINSLWLWYQQATGGIALLVAGTNYAGFRLIYADGASETWMINPLFSLSSIKLFDTPLPGSLTSPTRSGCN